MIKNAYFAGGCFWCITPTFASLNGVKSVISGYSGGKEVNPSYEEVKKQKTLHRETIKIEYDDSKVRFEELLDIFINSVDPFDGGGQFIDRGRSYTLAIYYNDDYELDASKKVIKRLEEKSKKEVFIALEKFDSFYEAEEYHQMYYEKNPKEFEEEMINSGRKTIKKSNNN